MSEGSRDKVDEPGDCEEDYGDEEWHDAECDASAAEDETAGASPGGVPDMTEIDALDPQVWVKPLELDAYGLEAKLGKLDPETRAAVEAAIIAETAAMKSSSWPVPDKEWADFTPDEKRQHLPAVMAAALRELGVAHQHVDRALAEKEAAEKGAAGQPAP